MANSSTAGRNGRADRRSEAEIVLGFLDAIERDEHVTQRALSRDLDIALGLANAYMKRLVRKGFVKVKEIPLRRYSYYLTPKGFTEKARLTTEYLSVSLTFFRQARRECTELLNRCALRGWRRVALAGTGELAEIATLCGNEQIELVAVIDAGHAGERFAGLPVVEGLERLDAVDAVLVTDLSHPQAIYDDLVAALPVGRVLTPGLLRVVASRAAQADERLDEAV